MTQYPGLFAGDTEEDFIACDAWQPALTREPPGSYPGETGESQRIS